MVVQHFYKMHEWQEAKVHFHRSVRSNQSKASDSFSRLIPWVVHISHTTKCTQKPRIIMYCKVPRQLKVHFSNLKLILVMHF
ncbi:hypothetical protein LINGRAHAP2_LOCUS2084 [Linum grandiflorum]